MEWFNEFVEWVWARHHNVASWYIRPAFLLPYCYFAYRRNKWGLIATIVLFPTTLFWFPAPETPSPAAVAYLAWEKEMVTQGSLGARLLMLFLVVAFLVGFAAAFWRRSILIGLLILNAGGVAKVAYSVAFGGDTGWASLAPSLSSALIVNAVVLLVLWWWRARARKAREVHGSPSTPASPTPAPRREAKPEPPRGRPA